MFVSRNCALPVVELKVGVTGPVVVSFLLGAHTMVQQTWDNRLLWRAIAASVALHVLVALFLPVWTAQVSGGLQPVEAVSFAHVIRMRLQRPSAKSLPAVAPRTARRANTISFARNRAELTASTRRPIVRPSAQNGPVGTIAAAPKLVASRDTPLYARPAPKTEVAVQQASPAPTPQPQASQGERSVSGAGTSDRGGLLPFTATQDPVLDPGVRTQLEKRFAVHVTLVVTVGEDGHTKRVVFQPPIDADTEHAIEALLADANWDAAVCGGGVSCEGTATIKL